MLIQLMKLASLGKLMGGIAHTFNNVLGGILGYSQLMKEELEEDSEAFRQVEVIEGASKRASSLVSQIQMLSHKHSGRKNYVDPRAVVAEVLAVVRSSFSRNIAIESSLRHGKARICVDATALCHALLNLCINAREAMPQGGKLKLSTEAETSTQTSDARFETASLIFRVSDTGCGIAAGNLERIFEPFFSTKQEDLASGLGLSIARSLIQDQEGRIEVSSSEGQNTIFSIWIPAVAPLTAHVVPDASEDATEATGGGQLIMVVDDEEDLRHMARQILEKKGYRVVVADCGQSAIRILEDRGNDIALIILDMNMPGDDGTRVYEALQSLDSTAKVIITSGYTHNSPYQSLIDSCGAPFIAKPWDLPDLLDETRRVLNSN